MWAERSHRSVRTYECAWCQANHAPEIADKLRPSEISILGIQSGYKALPSLITTKSTSLPLLHL